MIITSKDQLDYTQFDGICGIGTIKNERNLIANM